MKKHTLDSIAKEVYGGEPAEQAAFAKEHGFLPDSAGLIEFDFPVNYITEYDGEQVPVMGLISVEDGTPLTDEELEEESRKTETKAGEVSTSSVMAASSYEPYRWRRTNGNIWSFGMGTRWPSPAVSGHVGSAINAVSLDGRLGPGAAYHAQTKYSTNAFGNMGGGHSQWSPLRTSGLYRRYYNFTSTVWGFGVSVWWA